MDLQYLQEKICAVEREIRICKLAMSAPDQYITPGLQAARQKRLIQLLQVLADLQRFYSHFEALSNHTATHQALNEMGIDHYCDGRVIYITF